MVDVQSIEYSSKIQRDIYIFGVQFRLEWNHGSVGYGKQCLLLWSCIDERGCSCLEKGIRFWGWWSMEERQAEENIEKAGWGLNCNGWFEMGRWTLSIKVECLDKSDCCWVEVNLATLSCCGCYLVLDIGVSSKTYVKILFIFRCNFYRELTSL